MGVKVVQLGDICDFAYGDGLIEAERQGGLYPVYGSNGIVGWHDQALTTGPTIVIGRKGSIGEIHFSDGPCWPIDTTYYVESTKQSSVLIWLYYMLLALDLTQLNKSAAVPGLNRNDAYEKRVPFPPLPEQQRIAAILARADRLRRLRRYALELSAGYLQAVFGEMFGHQLRERRSRKQLGDLVTITGGGTPSRPVSRYYEGTIPWLTSKDMRGDYIFDTQEHITQEAIDSSATKLVPTGSLLVVVKSKVLMHRLPVAMTRVPLCHGQDIKSIQCSSRIDPYFAVYVLKYNESRLLSQARGANTEGLTLPMLQEIPVPEAELSQQRQFAQIVQRFDRVRAQQREAARQAEQLFGALLGRAFRGEL
jgi:restriction endonuclease S subunit